MTKILKAVSPRDEKGNDPNDFRGDPEFLKKILESAAANGKPEPLPARETLTGPFLYTDHRTTRRGRLVLEYVHTETGLLALQYFNVNLLRYRPGHHGQFTSKRGSKFRAFWLQVFDEPPRRWNVAHKSLYRLSRLSLSGTAEKHGDEWRISDVHVNKSAGADREHIGSEPGADREHRL